MTMMEIAEEIGTTKQNVNQILKRAMRKVYKRMRALTGHDHTPFQTMCCIAQGFGIKSSTDFKYFFFDFPNDVKLEVIASAREVINIPPEWENEHFLIKDFNCRIKEPTKKEPKQSKPRSIRKKRAAQPVS